MKSTEKFGLLSFIYNNPSLSNELKTHLEAHVTSLQESGLLEEDRDRFKLTEDGLNLLDNHINVVHVNFVKLISKILGASRAKFQVFVSKVLTFMTAAYYKIEDLHEREAFVKTILMNCSPNTLRLLDKHVKNAIIVKEVDYDIGAGPVD